MSASARPSAGGPRPGQGSDPLIALGGVTRRFGSGSAAFQAQAQRIHRLLFDEAGA